MYVRNYPSQSSEIGGGLQRQVSTVSRIPDRGGKTFKKPPAREHSKKDADNNSNKEIRCFCCGRTDDRMKDPKCPALKAKCSHCGKFGHFAKVWH